jgi:hypothetical protein
MLQDTNKKRVKKRKQNSITIQLDQLKKKNTIWEATFQGCGLTEILRPNPFADYELSLSTMQRFYIHSS